MDAKKAIMVVAHKLAILLFHAIKNGQPYTDPDDHYTPSQGKLQALKKVGILPDQPKTELSDPITSGTASAISGESGPVFSG